MASLPLLHGRDVSSLAVLENFQKAVVVRCRAYKKAFKDCRKSFSERSVHQLRVETRRLLALIALLKLSVSDTSIGRPKKRLRKVFKHLAGLRDAQVQLEHFRAQQGTQPEMAHLCRVLVKHERRAVAELRVGVRQEQTRKIKRALRRLRRRANLGLRSVKPGSLARNSFRALDQAFAKVAMLRSRPDALDAETIHRTRVACKKLRYLAEILRPILTDTGQEPLQGLRSFQSLTGQIQDIEMFEKAIARFVGKDRAKMKQFRQFREALKARHSELISHYAETTEVLLPLPHPATRRKRSRIALN